MDPKTRIGRQLSKYISSLLFGKKPKKIDLGIFKKRDNNCTDSLQIVLRGSYI